ncbi:hypothetical protein A3C94_01795 [Candidatus Kaiserbacteria bacterium RIFCSPHIGHO2_02_FULL_55_17]|uniref:DoxX family protein n=1 Tax=Candidatus Kaiserbacteria bacterium RIFCSPHIGHO2_02_FULL_55_17 TaxID=1798496 RepID=A0A1F6DTR5_9BACT|nr:MAG: hypothetical protein A3C94_01795 [Candidatus Kaiserbacteria bacterium RIFCSPHIGHO2_02_FULL_55_17]
MNCIIQQSAFAHFFTASTKSAPFWLVVRLYLGWEWLVAGWVKVTNPAWFGADAGAAMQGFINGAIAKTACAPEVPAAACHPDVQLWYASFLQNAVLPNLTAWSNAIAVGELLVGLGLIVGLFIGIAAFFGFFMNINFLFAGAVSLNPVWLVLALGLMLARRVAGYWGLDRYARPYLSRVWRSRNVSATT